MKSTNARKRIKTRISEAYWFNPCGHNGSGSVEPARIPTMSDEAGGLAWFDSLLQGGILLPESSPDQRRALTILLTGPPGVGKSVFATELAYRLSRNEGRSTLYVTSEAHQPWLIEKSKSFGWDDVENHLHVDPDKTTGVRVLSAQNLGDIAPPETSHFWDNLKKFLSGTTAESEPEQEAKSPLQFQQPNMVVVDSLNSVEDAGTRTALFHRFHKMVESGPEILLVVLDSAPSRESAEFWEFASDIVIRLDRYYVGTQEGETHENKGASTYMIRTLEILKARYQSHVWGVHQLKIYEPTEIDAKKIEEKQKGRREGVEKASKKARDTISDEVRAELERAHPYRREGGIFVFPSIHYVLSVYKRTAFDHTGGEPSGVPGLHATLSKGYPNGRCTALIGDRGGHKSHLGYLEVLHRIVSDEKRRAKGLIISLRDDEVTTRNTMDGILKETYAAKGTSLDQLEREGRLSIAYYPPGYITPEEFFHRLLLMIHSLKNSDPAAHMTLLFNSLDQLSSRFPLCAREDIFVPGIIQMLSAERVSSFFVAAQEPNRPAGEYYGLEAMAELILSFSRQPVEKNKYCAAVSEHCKRMKKDGYITKLPTSGVFQSFLGKTPDNRGAVQVEVIRYAGGEAAGAKGTLELINDDDPLYRLYGERSGLHFLPGDLSHGA